jgi:endonuclease G
MKALTTILLILISTISFSQSLPQKIDEDNQIIQHNGYIVSYNETCEQANWVYYVLKPSDLVGTETKRRNDFRADDSVKTGSAELSDYKYSGYDRGHLKPAGDEPCDSAQMSETFFLSNIAPMDASFNRGAWKRLENHVRNLAIDSDSIIVITGGVLKEGLNTIGDNKVCVPSHFFKVLYIYKKGKLEVMCFLMSNSKLDENISTYLVEIDALEDFVKIDF